MSRTITGGNFKKMLMHAGHTKGYLSTSIKQQLHNTKLSSGQHASSILHNDKVKVDRRDAIKIIQKLKDEHLAHGVTSTATTFIDKSIRQQKVAEENIRKENLAARTKEIAQERQAELAKTAKPASHTAVAGAHVPMTHATPQTSSPKSTPHLTTPAAQFHRPMTPSAPVSTPRPTITPGHGIPTEKRPEETIDLAID